MWKPAVPPFPCLALLIFVSKHSSLPYWEEDLKWQCTGLPASFQLNALLAAHRQSVQTGKAFRVSTSVLGSESHRQASSLWFVTSNYRLFQSCGPLVSFLAHRQYFLDSSSAQDLPDLLIFRVQTLVCTDILQTVRQALLQSCQSLPNGPVTFSFSVGSFFPQQDALLNVQGVCDWHWVRPRVLPVLIGKCLCKRQAEFSSRIAANLTA